MWLYISRWALLHIIFANEYSCLSLVDPHRSLGYVH